MSTWDTLGDNLLVGALRYLPWNGLLGGCCRVCRKWNMLIQTEVVAVVNFVDEFPVAKDIAVKRMRFHVSRQVVLRCPQPPSEETKTKMLAVFQALYENEEAIPSLLFVDTGGYWTMDGEFFVLIGVLFHGGEQGSTFFHTGWSPSASNTKEFRIQ